MKKDELKIFIAAHKEKFDSDAPGDHVWKNIADVMDEKDDLKSFVDENKESFDSELPGDFVWESIEKTASPKRLKIRFPNAMRVAASVVIILSFAFLIYKVNTKEKIIVVHEISEFSLRDLSPELAEVEVHYTSMINQRMDELNTYEMDDEDNVSDELKELDEDFKKLKEEMNSNVNNDKIVEAMILNYRSKLDILENLLGQLKDSKSEEYDGNKSI
jgi:gas vesicle protein